MGKVVVILFLALLFEVNCQFNPHFIGKRSGIVHLFEWKWLDIARECEKFLGPKGFGGVQVSPVNENAIVQPLRPWYERYQPMSYKIKTRSGNEAEFKQMVKRCRNAGVRIYVDVVVNHMAPAGASAPVNGTGGSKADPLARKFPAVPFSRKDFHQTCAISNYNNATNVRDCELASLPDLDQSKEHVRREIVNFMNHLIDLGVAGFRMDACKHMWPADLKVIYGRLHKLNPRNGFPLGSKPFIFQEVIDMGNEAIKRQDYTDMGAVTEFTYSAQIGMVFRKIERDLSALSKWGVESGFLPSKQSFVFVCNHDNQRGHGSGGSMILNYKERDLFTKASVFMLAHPHGIPRLMSSFAFEDPSIGPPQDSNQRIISPKISPDGHSCQNGWVCEHRWRAIANMVKFRSITDGTIIKNFRTLGDNQIAFCRGNKGLVVINNSNGTINQELHACVPDGTYCDVISGELINNKCSGKTIQVENGKAFFSVADIVAIHAGAAKVNRL